MPVSEFHGQVAAIALRAAAPHGFALGGGNALIAHGVIDRFTQDVDVFSDEEGGVEAAADAVEAALRAAGFGTGKVKNQNSTVAAPQPLNLPNGHQLNNDSGELCGFVAHDATLANLGASGFELRLYEDDELAVCALSGIFRKCRLNHGGKDQGR